MRGYFVSFEGPDGAGKSTVLKEVLNQIGSELKTQYLVTREPGGSKIAEKIRDIILDPANDKMDNKTEALLYAASRSQHVEEIIQGLQLQENSWLSGSSVCNVMVIYTAGTSYNCYYCFDYNCSMLFFKVTEAEMIIVYQYQDLQKRYSFSYMTIYGII